MKQVKAEAPFETLIVDEAHLLKNRCTFWTMAVALVGTHSGRRIPLTGTPYNNGPSDLATLMTMIDENKSSANKSWWDKATKQSSSTAIAESVTEWHETYLLRRLKNVILKDLPTKVVKAVTVQPNKEELFV
jgi:SNF2 family DNA or RNA helicase